jgi:demethylmenaquinone methyltransferase/2-methoxy-6-polyprenyl-1,4-benzoquinol methylase
MFGRIAPRYDLLNRSLSLRQDVRWRRLLARRIAETRADVVLDVCTGTGDVALALDGPGITIGSDFCLPMLALARPKAQRLERRLPLVAADALLPPFDSGSVDAVTVAFGVRNFESLEKGLAELVRVLRPGGTLLILEFSRPSGPLAGLLRWWTATLLPIIGRVVSGDPEAYSYLPASVAAFPEGEAMCALLGAAGLIEVRPCPVTWGVATLYEGIKPIQPERRQE